MPISSAAHVSPHNPREAALKIGVQKPPANVELQFVVDVEKAISDQQQQLLNLNNVNATHVDGREESGYISHHASTQCNQGGTAIRPMFHQLLRQLFECREAFRALSVRHLQDR